MLNLEITPAMGIAHELIKAGTWDDKVDVLPTGYAETAILWQFNPDASMRLRMPAEIPSIQICVNGHQGRVMYPEVAETVQLHPMYVTADKKKDKAQAAPASKKRKAETPYWTDRKAEHAREIRRADIESTSRRSKWQSRSNTRTLVLEKEANAMERMFTLQLDKERHKKHALLDAAYAEEAAEAEAKPRVRVKVHKSKNRGLDNRNEKAPTVQAEAGPSGMNTSGRLTIYLTVLALTLIYLLSRLELARES